MTGVALRAGEPLAIVGDVHGCAERLRLTLEDLLNGDRRIVLVGDYIDRGPDSRSVLELLVEARRSLADRLVLLRGNHEVALLQMLEAGLPSAFLRHRGATTIRSYLPDPGPNVLEDFRHAFPRDHLRLLQETALYAQGPELLISHAGYNPVRPNSRSERDLTTGSWQRLLEARRPPRPLVVVGHYTQPSGMPFRSEHLIGLDTGCGTLPSGPLTVFLHPDGTFHAY